VSEVETQAKLRWEAACERLRFAMSAPKGLEALDLAEGFSLAQTALDGLRDVLLVKPSRNS